ncbi:MAG TPA: nitroreductase family protein [Candidatus Hydrogenedentes bacterium]|nr:nitroreductase family protein [Candidatus Hydrogenedentota bacterium]HIJ72879.1 nitroreductase family protein [Candidatus Hydrogenedentota bacterium]
MLRDLVLCNRSYRRFDEDVSIDAGTLRELVDLARLTPSAANLQPLKYALSHTPDKNAQVFAQLAWAGYLEDWPGPAPGERPTAYIVILGDKEVSKGFGCDYGIAAQTMLLGAAEKGIGGCMFGSINRARLLEVLNLPPERYEVLLVVALGKPVETVVLDEVTEASGIKYWRDADGVHHVPKRALDDLIVG